MANTENFTSEQLLHMASHFAIPTPIQSAERYGDGHINDTFLLKGPTPYILQRLNTSIFANPEGVMANIVSVSAEIRKKILAAHGNPERESMTVIFAKDGRSYYRDLQGGFWRCYLYIGHTLSLKLPRNEADFKAAAYAFGHFQYLLQDYPASSLFVAIPHFHDTPSRYQDFLAAVAADKAHRVKEVGPEIAFAEARAKQADGIVSRLAKGIIPTRVTHNDTKLNNVLLDEKTGQGLCVIDLDTIMPGSALYDFGDAIRFGANTAAEDEKDLSKVSLSLPLFKTYTEGYLEGCKGSLTPEEIRLFPLGAYLMTYECGLRFLADYLNGDIYFHTAYPEHNLVRARDQFALVADMEKKAGQLQQMIEPFAQKREKK